MSKFSKNPYGRKREGAGSTIHDPGVVHMTTMAPAVEANGGVEHTAVPSAMVVVAKPEQQAAAV